MDHKFQNISQCWPKCWPSMVLPPRGPPAVFSRQKRHSPAKTCGVPARGGASGGFFSGKNDTPLGTSMEFPPRGPPAVFSRQNDIPLGTSMEFPPRVASGGFFPGKTTIPSKQVSIFVVFVTFRSILTQIGPIGACGFPYWPYWRDIWVR